VIEPEFHGLKARRLKTRRMSDQTKHVMSLTSGKNPKRPSSHGTR
jgi:hypothetical protein